MKKTTPLLLMCFGVLLSQSHKLWAEKPADNYRLDKAVSTFSNLPDNIAEGDVSDQSFYADYRCPSADVFSFKNGAAIAVCESVTPEPSMPGAYLVRGSSLAWFSYIVAKDAGGKTQLMFSGGGEEAQPELVRPTTDGLVYIEALFDNGVYHSVFATPVSCANGHCTAGKKTCAIDVPKNAHTDVVKKLKKEKIKKEADVPGPEDERTLRYLDLLEDYSNALLIRALTGDKAAKTLLRQPPFEMDGHYSETWAASADVFDEAEKLGCLP